MPRVFKNFQSTGFFIPFADIPCYPMPVYNQTDKETFRCKPGVPYDVVAEYLFTESPDENSMETTEMLWLGLRPSKLQQDELDWVLASDMLGKVPGVYCRFNRQDSDVVEET